MNTKKQSQATEDRSLSYFERYGNRIKSSQGSKPNKIPSYRTATPNLFGDEPKFTPKKRAQSRGLNQYSKPSTTFGSHKTGLKQPLTSRARPQKPSINPRSSQRNLRSKGSLHIPSKPEEPLFVSSSSKKQIKSKIGSKVSAFNSRLSKPVAREKYTLEKPSKTKKMPVKVKNIYQQEPQISSKETTQKFKMEEQQQQEFDDDFDDEAYLAEMMGGQDDCFSELLKDHDDLLAGFLKKTTFKEEEKQVQRSKPNGAKQGRVGGRKAAKKKMTSALDQALKRNKLGGGRY